MENVINKHTPGPWSMEFSEKHKIALILDNGTKGYIAELDLELYDSHDRGIEEAAGNANLITLAPSMEKRIEELEDALRRMVDACGVDEKLFVAIQKSLLTNEQAKDQAEEAYEATQEAERLLRGE